MAGTTQETAALFLDMPIQVKEHEIAMKPIFGNRTVAITAATLAIFGALGVGIPAAAATAPAATCATNPKLNGVDELNANALRSDQVRRESTIELWYSPTCRTTWAVEEDGLVGDGLWVFNENTGAQRSAMVTTDGARTVTAAIDDAGTQSHACMSNNASTFPPAMAKTCTPYF